MTEPTDDSPSQGSQTGGVPEPEPKAQPEPKTEPVKTQTGGVKTVRIGDLDIPQDSLQAYIDEVTKNRIAEVKDKTRQEVKSKYKDYEDLKTKASEYDKLQREKLSEEEKAKARLEDLQKQITEREEELKARNLRDLKRSKIEQAIADGKMELPKGKTIESLLKRMLGTTEEEIDSDIEDLAGFFPKTEPSKAIGGGSQQPAAKTPTLDEQIAELDRKLTDPKLSLQDRSRLVDQQMALMLKRDGLIRVK